MGLRETLKNKRIYFDTNIFIYLLEGNVSYIKALNDIKSILANNQATIFSCDLAHTEILPYHAKYNNQRAIQHIVQFLDNFEILRISKEIAIHAGILRGELGMKTPDALHVATALNQNCHIFLTNDAGIRVPEHRIQRILLSEC